MRGLLAPAPLVLALSVPAQGQESSALAKNIRRHSKSWAILLVAGFLAAFGGTASADFCIPSIREGSPEYRYLSAVVDSLQWVKEAHARADTMASAAKAEDRLVILGRAKMAYECAADQVSPFKDSKHLTEGEDAIASSASGLAGAFTEWGAMADSAQDEYVARIEGKQPDPRLIAQRQLRGEQLWDVTKGAVMMALLAIPTQTPNGKMGGSILTRPQAQEIGASLLRTFGKKVVVGMKDGQGNLDSLAASIYYVVLGQNRPFAIPALER